MFHAKEEKESLLAIAPAQWRGMFNNSIRKLWKTIHPGMSIESEVVIEHIEELLIRTMLELLECRPTTTQDLEKRIHTMFPSPICEWAIEEADYAYVKYADEKNHSKIAADSNEPAMLSLVSEMQSMLKVTGSYVKNLQNAQIALQDFNELLRSEGAWIKITEMLDRSSDLSQLDVYNKLKKCSTFKFNEWELQREDIELLEPIGRGKFGNVYRGRAKDVTSPCGVTFGECAVKTLTETVNSTDRLHFLMEASVMKQFNAAFIVKLYGVVSDGPQLLVIKELMECCNLRDYLHCRRPGAEENIQNSPRPSSDEQFQWAAQIADGMNYLESLKFFHQFLAARNCMVSADNVVKIGDFGMAADISLKDHYKQTGKRSTQVHVRWMAPESLQEEATFIHKSDVWSYGIVLHEIVTLGQLPYAGLSSDQVCYYVGVQHKTLRRPSGCPDVLYDLMAQCWRFDPNGRPSFAKMVEMLLPYTNERFRKESYHVNQNPELLQGYVRMGEIVNDEEKDGNQSAHRSKEKNKFCTLM